MHRLNETEEMGKSSRDSQTWATESYRGLPHRRGVTENTACFGEVLEAVDKLSADEQETLVLIVRRRLAEQGRKRLAQDILESREEFAQGQCDPTTVEDLMKEIRS